MTPEQEQLFQELLNFLKGKTVGSPEFIAFSDFIEPFHLKRRIALNEHQVQALSTRLQLIEHEVHRSKASIRGYYEAYEKIEDIYELLRDLKMKENDIQSYFTDIQDALKDKAPLDLSLFED